MYSRTQIVYTGNMGTVTSLPVGEPLIWLHASYVGGADEHQARCGCGWRGGLHARPTPAGDDAKGHHVDTGHRLGGPGDADLPESGQRTANPSTAPAGRWHHARCGWVHSWADDCPTAATSVTGRVRRILNPARDDAADRLAAVYELGRWLDDEEHQAVIHARMSGVSWAEIGAAFGGLSRQAAHNRWGSLIRGMEAAGLVDAPAEAGPAHPPRLAEWGELGNATTWCRWCGQRLMQFADGWQHTTPDGERSPGLDATFTTACHGPEPWPARDPWPDDPPAGTTKPRRRNR
jgi:hypothetical protein